MENSQQQQQQEDSAAEYGYNIDSKWPATRNFLLTACNYIIGAEIRQKNTQNLKNPPTRLVPRFNSSSATKQQKALSLSKWLK